MNLLTSIDHNAGEADISGPIDLIIPLSDVASERFRQEELRRSGKFKWTCADPNITNSPKLAVLGEEFGEVSRCVCEAMNGNKDLKHLREELIQVAAVSVAWVEAIDKELEKTRIYPELVKEGPCEF